MKKCNDCNCEMIENCSLSGKHPFEVDFSERVDISVSIPTGKKAAFSASVTTYRTYAS